MSKAVLISIRPKWCELIAKGKKTVEIRKTFPKLETPFRCYIYCTEKRPLLTRGKFPIEIDTVCVRTREAANTWGLDVLNGKVIGEFTCDFIEYLNNLFVGEPDYHMPEYGNACLELKDLENYGKGKRLYGWHISDLVIYDKPKELSEFDKPMCTRESDCGAGCSYFDPDLVICKRETTFKRPPQSWCYVK
jgi:predicted transcriptional regulator